MIETGVLDTNRLDGAIEEVTGKSKGKAQTITFDQFVDFIDILQDAMEVKKEES